MHVCLFPFFIYKGNIFRFPLSVSFTSVCLTGKNTVFLQFPAQLQLSILFSVFNLLRYHACIFLRAAYTVKYRKKIQNFHGGWSICIPFFTIFPSKGLQSRRLFGDFPRAGLFLGAVTGGLIGLATESGLFRGTGIGAITGALVSIEVVDSSIRVWRSRRSGISSICYVLNVIYSLLTGRLVREKVDPAVQRVVRSQMNAVDSSHFRESPDLFEIEGTNGMPRASIDKLPEVRITEEYKRNAIGDLSGCSVCLQDFQNGEKVRSLPDCWHVFHVPCIDGWLIKHGSCPLCRRKL
ncbi:hypothetical protein GUJ93_ZPchr0012g20548 [Zizania palustris]|uniref:RING-type domain-containing protein n=1 Tax=Zizania palustris TaxID=103762 RepID=A0A8J6BXM4_ZIZPA|nr:hypothetical protein GUJ93_ZPchr0012g20548 [Zizania palustris]